MSESFKPNHYWLETHSDKKGIPIEYVCVKCGKKFKIISRDKKARDYLKEKYSNIEI